MDEKVSEAQIRQAWEDTGRGSSIAVWKFLREEGTPASKADVEAVIKRISVQQVYGPPPKFKGHITASGPGERWMVDLADLTAQQSNHFGLVESYILVVVDVFSRYIWAVSMVSKRPEEVADVFKALMREAKTTPKSVTTDRGAEFTGPFQALLEGFEIAHALKEGPQDIAVVDVAIQRLKISMFKALAEKGGRDWSALLKGVVAGLNRRPQEGYLGGNSAGKAWHAPQHPAKNNLLEYELIKENSELLKASGEQVQKRAAKLEDYGQFRVLERPKSFTFKRGYKPQWSDKVHDVFGVNHGYVVDTDGRQVLTKLVMPVPAGSSDVALDPRLRQGSDSIDKKRMELLEPFKAEIREFLSRGPRSFRYVWLYMKEVLMMEEKIKEARINYMDTLRFLGFEVRDTGSGAILSNPA